MQTWQIFAAVVIVVAIVLIALLLGLRARRSRQQRRRMATAEPQRDPTQAAEQANPDQRGGQAGPGTHPPDHRSDHEADGSLFDDVPTSPVGDHQVDATPGPDRDDRTVRLPVRSADPSGDQSDPAATTYALPVVNGRSNGRQKIEEPEPERSDEPHRHARLDGDDLLVPMSVAPTQGPGGRHRAPTDARQSTEPAESAEPAELTDHQRTDHQRTEPRGGQIVADARRAEPANAAGVAPLDSRSPVVPQQNIGRSPNIATEPQPSQPAPPRSRATSGPEPGPGSALPMPRDPTGAAHDGSADVTTAIPTTDPGSDRIPDGAAVDDDADLHDGRSARSLADRLLGRHR